MTLRWSDLRSRTLVLASAVLALSAVPSAFGQAPNAQAACPPDKSGLCMREDYRIQLSDVLELHLPFSPEYDETVTVQPDGFIRLKEAAPIRAAGLKVTELQAAITQAYTGTLKDPVVSISLKDFQKPAFFASGEVGHPGRYELRSDVTLLQAISEAGGLISERSSKKQVVIFHPQGNGMYESRIVDVASLLKSKSMEDLPIRPGDIIYVPQNKMSKIARYLPTPSVGTYAGAF